MTRAEEVPGSVCWHCRRGFPRRAGIHVAHDHLEHPERWETGAHEIRRKRPG